GCRCGSDPVWLWLWHMLVATAPIRPLAWEPPSAAGAAQEIAKRQINQSINQSPREIISKVTSQLSPKARPSVIFSLIIIKKSSIEICLARQLQMDVTTQQLGGTLLSVDSTAQTGSWALATAGRWQASWWLLTASGPVREPFHNGLSGSGTCRDRQENVTSHQRGLLS
uniref:Uncharacterized protein n=1 Tax=Sus scrofa TaxID=9823 RepID=A0A4X1TSJ4_PIG